MAQRAKIVLTFGIVAEGDSVTINLDGAPRTFVCAWETDEEYYPFLPGEGIVAATALEQTIMSVYGESYTCTVSGNQLTVEPRNFGNKYNFGYVTSPGIAVFSQQDNINGPLILSSEVTDVRCYGTPTGSVDLTAAGGATAKTYLWSDGSAEPDLYGVTVGTYSVTVTDEDGASASLSGIAVNQPAAPLAVTAAKQDVSVYAGADGEILLGVTGGTPGYTFLWADGATTQNRFALPAGEYSVTVTDTRGCSATASITLAQPAGIEVVAETGPDYITLTVIGGVMPYTFSWNDGVATKDRVNLEPGTYACLITDANGATASVTVTLTGDRFYFSKNPIVLRLQALSPETKPNLSFVCEVWVEREYGTDVFELVGVPLEQPADAAGATVFEVQAVLDAFVGPSVPVLAEGVPRLADRMFKRFYLRHTERYGEPPVDSTFTQVEKSFVVFGGVSFEEYAAGSFPRYLTAKKPFFTWEPLRKPAFPDQHEFLYFMLQADGPFTVRFLVVFADGTVSQVNFEPVVAKRFEMYWLPVGYRVLEQQLTLPAKLVRYWEVWVEGADGVAVSEVRTFDLETEYQPHVRYFLFLNSLGGYNTLACTGLARQSLDPDTQTIERPRSYYSAPDAPDTEIVSRTASPTLFVNTGPLTRARLEALQDLLISTDVRLVERGRYVPGRIKDKTAGGHDDEETLPSLDLDFERPRLYRYTPVLP